LDVPQQLAGRDLLMRRVPSDDGHAGTSGSSIRLPVPPPAIGKTR
jgi:hypothetical protein